MNICGLVCSSYLHDCMCSFDGFEGLVGRPQRLDWPQQHHTHHHDGEDGDAVAGHEHQEQIHGNLHGRQEGFVRTEHF